MPAHSLNLYTHTHGLRGFDICPICMCGGSKGKKVGNHWFKVLTKCKKKSLKRVCQVNKCKIKSELFIDSIIFFLSRLAYLYVLKRMSVHLHILTH